MHSRASALKNENSGLREASRNLAEHEQVSEFVEEMRNRPFSRQHVLPPNRRASAPHGANSCSLLSVRTRRFLTPRRTSGREGRSGGTGRQAVGGVGRRSAVGRAVGWTELGPDVFPKAGGSEMAARTRMGSMAAPAAQARASAQHRRRSGRHPVDRWSCARGSDRVSVSVSGRRCR